MPEIDETSKRPRNETRGLVLVMLVAFASVMSLLMTVLLAPAPLASNLPLRTWNYFELILVKTPGAFDFVRLTINEMRFDLRGLSSYWDFCPLPPSQFNVVVFVTSAGDSKDAFALDCVTVYQINSIPEKSMSPAPTWLDYDWTERLPRDGTERLIFQDSMEGALNWENHGYGEGTITKSDDNHDAFDGKYGLLIESNGWATHGNAYEDDLSLPDQTTGKYLVASFYFKLKTTAISQFQAQLPMWDGVNEYYNKVRYDFTKGKWQYAPFAPTTTPPSSIGWEDFPAPPTSISNQISLSGIMIGPVSSRRL
jgi:hypothetical protein